MITLQNVNIQFSEIILKTSEIKFNIGKFNLIKGPSGSGKSTLLKILNGEYRDFYDHYSIDHVDIKNMDERSLDEFLLSRIFYLNQSNDLLENITCFDLIDYYLKLSNNTMKREEILQICNIQFSKKTYPINLSGGEKQRYQLALAIASNCDILLCDEITSSLDDKNTKMVLDILKYLVKEYHKTIIIASHEQIIEEYADVIYTIDNKCIIENNKQTIENTISVESNKPNYKSAIDQLITGKLKNYLIRFLVFTIICSLLSSLCVIGKQASNQYSNMSSYLKSKMVNNQIYFTNLGYERDQYHSNHIHTSLPPLTVEQLNILSNESKIRNLEQVLFFDLIDETEDSSIIINNQSYYSNCNFIYSINSQVDLNKYCNEYIDGVEGLYLTEASANMIGLDHIDVNTTINMDLYVPVKYTEIQNGYNDAVSAISGDGMNSIFTKINVDIPVIGILEQRYESYLPNSFGYIDYKYMNNIQTSLVSQTHLGENEFYMKPNIYSGLVSQKDYEQIMLDLYDNSSSIFILNPSKSVDNMFADWVNTEGPMKVYTGILFIITVLLVFGYGYLRLKQDLHDLQLYKVMHLSQKRRLQIIIYEMIIVLLITMVLTYPMSRVLLDLCIKKQIIATTVVYQQQIHTNTILTIVFSGVLVLFSYAFELLYLKKKG